MKKTAFIILPLLAVLTTFVTLAGKHANVSAQTAAHEEIVLADPDLDGTADTLGGSTGGAPEIDSYELYVFDYVEEDTAAYEAQKMNAVVASAVPAENEQTADAADVCAEK